MKAFRRFDLVALLAAILFLCSPARAWDDSLDSYREKGVIISASPYWKPYSFLGQDDELEGFLIDYWRKWSEKTGISVQFRLAPWKETITLVRNGECDFQSGLYSSEERSQYLDFSQSIHRSKGVLAIKKGEPKSCEIVYSEPVGVIAGSYEESALKLKHPNTQARTYETNEAMLQAFVNGEVHAVVADLPTLMSLGGNLGIANDIEICDVVYERDLRAGLPKGNAALLSLVNEGLSLITAEEKEQISTKWFVAAPSDSGLLRLMVFGAFMILLAIGGGMIWSSRRS
ncbi:transporter substrate-binding domain-containing protein [uncultured Pseudodesulfovibrio sp.]|uniref:transporter substrate-binding domain-containing protein n=1 Tax=uncultured Pseudodesulfovibrio sp. TaxID=2035858 RepID=UPI0029C7E39C|nr:transporter substrate-binding domain-containing protein [uncultured Pseudodesulfovibrio sp.]